MNKPYRGSCLCGAIEFEVDGFLPAAHCHCAMCRKFHGAAFATIVSVSRNQFRWIQGEADLKSYTADNDTTRSFCRHCGSSLMFSSPRAPQDEIEIAMGCLDGPVPVVPNGHIFVGSAANWTVIADDLPQHEQGRDSPLVRR